MLVVPGPCFWSLVSYLFSNLLAADERAGCVTFIVLRLSVSLPLSVVGWYAVCNCNISCGHTHFLLSAMGLMEWVEWVKYREY